MKKIVLVFVIMLTPFIGNSQVSAFDKYDDLEDVNSYIVFKSAFELGLQFISSSEEAKELKELMSGLNEIKVYSTGNPKIAVDMKNSVSNYLKSTKMTELFRVKDQDGNARIYIKESNNKKNVKQLLMFVNGIGKHFKDETGDRKIDALIFSLTGDVELSKIAEIAEKLNLEGASHIKKISKKQ